MASHTATGEWQSFELRMRRRRADRLVLRADAAADEGRAAEARACLEEARQLAPGLPAIEAVQQKLDAPPARRSVSFGRMWKTAAVAAGVAIAAVALALPTWRPARVPVMTARDFRALSLKAPLVQMPSPLLRGRQETAEVTSQESEEAAAAESVPLSRSMTIAAAAPASPVPAVRADSSYPAPATARPSVSPASLSTPPAVAPPSVAPPPVTSSSSVTPPPVPAPPPPALPAAAITTVPIDAGPVATGAPAASRPAPVAPAGGGDEGVRSTLDRYAAAYNDLDAAAAERVWPAVNRAALSRAFDGLASQRVSLGNCRIDMDGTAARASCAGSATWAPKVGDGSPRTEARRWTFDLARRGDAWQIVSARVQKR